MLDRLRNFLRSFEADRLAADRRRMIEKLEEDAFHLSVEIATLTTCHASITRRLEQLRAEVHQLGVTA